MEFKQFARQYAITYGVKSKMEKEFEELNPDVWKPQEEGDSIEGYYISKKEEVGPNKSTAYYLELGVQQTMIWGTTIIDDRMSLAKVGDYIKIIYKGEKENKRGQNVKIFSVLRARTENAA